MATHHHTTSRFSDRTKGTRLLVQLTDCHIRADTGFTYDGIDTRESLQGVMALMQTRHGLPDAVVLTGDLGDDGSQAAYAWLRGCLTTLAVPVYCIPGNHDDAEVLRAVLPGDNVHVTDWAELGGWQLVLLSSAVAGREGGSLGRGGQDTLSGLLRFAGHAPTLVLLHHPPVPVGSPWLDTMCLDDAGAFFDRIDRHPNVRAVVFGHIHQIYDEARGTLRLLGTPSTCAQFTPRTERHVKDVLMAGYRWFLLRSDGDWETGIERLS
jgi:3',5'-cyclic-AMP phosphodiesterase